MHLPQAFQEKIPRVFGQAGRDWLERLPSLIDQSVCRWELTDCRLSPTLSYNLICFAESAAFGPVALKLGVPHPELYTEMKALTLYGGRGICRLHGHDEEMGALLLERVATGHDLHTVADSHERIRIAARMIRQLPIPVNHHHGLPAYADWVSRAFARARREGNGGPRLRSLIAAAESLYAELEAGAGGLRVLLHGDLHHQNILRDQAGAWKAIDPKGVVGLPILEAGRFVQNELDLVQHDDQPAHLERITSLLSLELGVPRRTVAMVALTDSVLSTCWHYEDNSPPDVIAERLDACERLLAPLSA